MEKPVRYGVIGIGGMGANHAKKLKAVSYTHLRAHET